MLNSEPQDGSPWRRAGHLLGFPGPPAGAASGLQVRRPPDTPTSARAPPPLLGPLGPPRARGGGSGVSRRHCSPSSALHHVRKEKRFFTRRGRGRGLQPGGAQGRKDPQGGAGGGGGGRRGGGEVARTGCGRGGEPHSGSHRLLPAPASTFCTAPSDTSPQSPGSCHGLHRGGRAAELGTGFPK